MCCVIARAWARVVSSHARGRGRGMVIVRVGRARSRWASPRKGEDRGPCCCSCWCRAKARRHLLWYTLRGHPGCPTSGERVPSQDAAPRGAARKRLGRVARRAQHSAGDRIEVRGGPFGEVHVREPRQDVLKTV